MELILRVVIGPNPRAERVHGKIVEQVIQTDDGPEGLYFVAGESTTNNLVDAELVGREIEDLFRVWGGADSLWAVTSVEQVDPS